MSHAARKSLVVPVPIADFQATIVDYAAYPRITDEVRSVRVVAREGNASSVAFTTKVMMKTIEYTLRMVEASVGYGMSWSLLSSPTLTINNGRWTLEALGPNETQVTYENELGARLWIPNSVLNSLSGVVLPRVLKRFSEYAQATARDGRARVA